jgi:hypothetical protein
MTEDERRILVAQLRALDEELYGHLTEEDYDEMVHRDRTVHTPVHTPPPENAE